jgi:hypothetical protein
LTICFYSGILWAMATIEAMIELRQHLADLKRQVEAAEQAIAAAEQRCSPHRWTETEYEPIHQSAYRIPGDPPLDVPARTEKRWKRRCTSCGKEQIFADPQSSPIPFVHRPKWD